MYVADRHMGRSRACQRLPLALAPKHGLFCGESQRERERERERESVWQFVILMLILLYYYGYLKCWCWVHSDG
jgi:hypothetical protein